LGATFEEPIDRELLLELHVSPPLSMAVQPSCSFSSGIVAMTAASASSIGAAPPSQAPALHSVAPGSSVPAPAEDTMKWCTSSFTRPGEQVFAAWVQLRRVSMHSIVCSRARCATFLMRTLRASGARVMPRTRVRAGHVVAFTTMVSAATPPTRKRTRSPSACVSLPSARSFCTRIASARPTMPRRPPQVMRRMSATSTRSPTRLSIGHSSTSTRRRMRVTAT